MLAELFDLGRMRIPEMVEPAQAEIQTAHVFVFPRGGNGLMHCRNGFTITSKVGLENCRIQKGILIVRSIFVMHSIVVVLVEIFE